ncbi:cation:proton antiporter [Streptomyces sp. NPDC058620]|uniref:cation:proton antiporter n=1 Tax=Streptomyces sp. NPDC058620 TaxID=3346560 RepID=UPI0036516ABE
MLSPDGGAALAATAPLGGEPLTVFLLQVGILLVCAYGLGWLAARVGLPPLVGELSAGVLLGPTVFGQVLPGLSDRLFPADISQAHLLDAFCQFGILLLVAITGAQFDTRILRRRGGLAARVSLAGLLIPLGLGIATGYLVPASLLTDSGERGVFALFLGVAMCVTALPVIAKTLADLNMTHRNIGQLLIAAAVFDDAVGWLLLALVTAMASGAAGGPVILTTMAWTAVFVAAACAVGGPLGRRLSRTGGNRIPVSVITVGVAAVVLYGALTAAAGMEALFGAFVAGATLLRHIDPKRLAPLRTLVMAVFAPVFLGSVGLRMDLTALAETSVLLTGIAILFVASLGKFAGAYIAARSGGMSRYEGLALGAGMNSRGMIEVVIALAGLRIGVLNTATFTIIVLIALVTSVTAPPLLRWTSSHIAFEPEEEEREERLTGWNTESVLAGGSTANSARQEKTTDAP